MNYSNVESCKVRTGRRYWYSFDRPVSEVSVECHENIGKEELGPAGENCEQRFVSREQLRGLCGGHR